MNNLTNTKPFPDQKYELVKILKENASITVSVKKHKKKSLYFVVKMLIECAQNRPNEILNEINIGKKLRHENFAKTIKNYYSPGKHFILIEFVDGGVTLKNFSRINEMTKIRVHDFKKIVTQIFNSIVYSLHQNICPVDVHDKNILVDLQHNVKVIDFGEYKENQHIKDFHYLYLEAHIRMHVSNLLSITHESYRTDCFDAWKQKLWSGKNFTKESLINHYNGLLSDPFLASS